MTVAPPAGSPTTREPAPQLARDATPALPGVAGLLMPAGIPRFARRPFALELLATPCFSLALACVEGGIVAVFVKQTFGGVVSARALAAAVALVGAAPEIANIVSFGWIRASQGRAKIPLINALQLGVIALVAMIAATPRSAAGLAWLVALALLARVLWSGIITLRPTTWRANFPRAVRAGVIGRISASQVLVVAGMGVLLGAAMDASAWSFRAILPGASLLACGAVVASRRIRVRRQWAILKAERESPDAVMPPWKGPLVVWRVLRRDRHYARFMMWLFVLGFANLMVPPVVVLCLKDQFHFTYLPSILISSSIPALTTSLSIPLWARLLNRAHVVRFRSMHAWTFVASTTVIALAAALHNPAMMYVGAVLQGIGFGGGSLAWNLGHVDFAPPQQTSQYMATHVTLNGIRGLLAPFVSVGLLDLVARARAASPGLVPVEPAAVVFGAALLLTIAGALGFVLLHRRMGEQAARTRRDT